MVVVGDPVVVVVLGGLVAVVSGDVVVVVLRMGVSGGGELAGAVAGGGPLAGGTAQEAGMGLAFAMTYYYDLTEARS